MKYLFILLIAFTHTCYAQKTITFEVADSLSKAGQIVIVKYDSIAHNIYYQIPVGDTTWANPVIKYDTVFIVMFLADTSERNVDNMGQVYWDFGYDVRRMGEIPMGEHMTYLDIDKRQLSKNLLVWQSK